MFELIEESDRELLIFLNNLGLEDYDRFWSTVTLIETWVPLYIIFGILIYFTYKNQKPWLQIAVGVLTFLLTMTLTASVKNLVRRLRPSNESELTELLRVLTSAESYSFFSGHAANSFALTTFVVLAVRSKYGWAPVFYLWPLLFSFSRIYVGVHYPTDIVVGALVGLLMGSLMFSFQQRYFLPRS
ncbi:phosphatase PAP2 family protein [Robertkochia aurantiaca]|uniref:phosphatase PAP2 family protein n=1 Tax=Robertkochia aurantiaca TaxID=2873700 RepID=UPI001CCDC724|nr:phosphatase PAP2 family protein [Robertkochia sp. 3YJGBD-33]